MRREMLGFAGGMIFAGAHAALTYIKPKKKRAEEAFHKGVCHPLDDRMDELREANIEWVRFDVGIRPLDGEGRETEGYRAFKKRAVRYRNAGYRVMAVTPFPEQYSGTSFSPEAPEYRKKIVRDAEYMAKDLRGIVSAFQVANEMQVEHFRFPLSEEQSVAFLGVWLEALNEVKGDIQVGFNLQGFTLVRYLRAMKRYVGYCDYVGLDLYLGCFESFIKETSFYDFVVRFIWGYTGKAVWINEFGYISK